MPITSYSLEEDLRFGDTDDCAKENIVANTYIGVDLINAFPIFTGTA